MSKEKEIRITFRYDEVKTSKHLILETEILNVSKKHPWVFEVSPAVKIDDVNNCVKILVFVNLYFDSDKKNKMMELVTESKFEVLNFYDVFKKTGEHTYKIPDQIIKQFISLAISTTRGILIAKSEGTIFDGIVLPAMDLNMFSKIGEDAKVEDLIINPEPNT